MPANGESAYIPCKPVVPVDVSLSLLKKEIALYDTTGAPDPKRPCRMHGVLIMKDSVLKLLEPEQAFGELGLNRHCIKFTSCVQIQLAGSVVKAMESLQQILNA